MVPDIPDLTAELDAAEAIVTGAEARGRIYYPCCRHCGNHGEHRNVRHDFPCEVPDCPGSVVRRRDHGR